jgi:hypothetical protein
MAMAGTVAAGRLMDAVSHTLLRRMLDALLGASSLWSRRAPFDEAVVASIMERLVLERHAGYVRAIPVYRRLAEESGLLEGADVGAIVDGMMFSTDVFKSYEPEWLESGDFDSMTAWIGEISSCRPPPPGPAVRDAQSWRAAMAREGVHLSSSSGTSGRPSFVPRDVATWQALCGNGRFYTTDQGAAPGSDFMALMPRGDASGLQNAATGLARGARESRFLEGPLDESLPAAAEFLASAAADGRPILVFGTPYHAARLCEHVLTTGDGIEAPAGSRMLTGGGWKTDRPMSRSELHELVHRALGLSGDAVVDAYSATELNCVLSTCGHGAYHVPPLIQPVVLDDALEWIAEDEAEGLLGFVDPFAGSYPGFLVTGDHGHLTSEPCECGLAGWSIRGEIVRAPGHMPRGCAGTLSAALQ